MMRKGSVDDGANWRIARKLFLAQSPVQNGVHADLTAPGASRTTKKVGNGTNLENPVHEESRGKAEAALESANPVEQVAGEIWSSIVRIKQKNNVTIFAATAKLDPNRTAKIFRDVGLNPNSRTKEQVLEALCQFPGLTEIRLELEEHLQKISVTK